MNKSYEAREKMRRVGRHFIYEIVSRRCMVGRIVYVVPSFTSLRKNTSTLWHLFLRCDNGSTSKDKKELSAEVIRINITVWGDRLVLVVSGSLFVFAARIKALTANPTSLSILLWSHFCRYLQGPCHRVLAAVYIFFCV